MWFKERLLKNAVCKESLMYRPEPPFNFTPPIVTVLVKGFQVIRTAGTAIGKRLAERSSKKRSITK